MWNYLNPHASYTTWLTLAAFHIMIGEMIDCNGEHVARVHDLLYYSTLLLIISQLYRARAQFIELICLIRPGLGAFSTLNCFPI